jgi:hypothetical protein
VNANNAVGRPSILDITMPGPPLTTANRARSRLDPDKCELGSPTSI